MSYTDFKDLEDFEDGFLFKTDQKKFLEEEMKMMTEDPENWFNQFIAINNLRIINKFYPEVLCANILLFEKFMKLSVENLRSNISKNSLMFCTEYFANEKIAKAHDYKKETLQFISTIMPAILLRTVYDKVFIANEGKQAVTNCLTNYVLPETFEITIKDGCKNKINNKKLIEESHVTHLKTIVNAADFSNKE